MDEVLLSYCYSTKNLRNDAHYKSNLPRFSCCCYFLWVNLNFCWNVCSPLSRSSGDSHWKQIVWGEDLNQAAANR